MNKKLLCALMLVAALVFIGAGCLKKSTSTSSPQTPASETNQEPAEKQPEESVKLTGRMTDEICTELMAHYLWSTYLLTVKKDVAAATILNDKIEGQYKKYGVTDNDYDEVCNAKVGDPEFMERIAKRMKELGFVEE